MPSTEIADVFEVSDERIRIDLEINHGGISFFASALCDGGASNQLTLPARKIVQLGLQPFGDAKLARSSCNTTTRVLRFEPVHVTLRFSRGEDLVEKREQYLVVSCHEDEYNAELEKSQQSNYVEIGTSCKSKERKKRKVSDASNSSSGSEVGIPSSLKLSPVSHRTNDRPNDRVVLGHEGLSLFHIHANFEKQVLEIEEDYEYADES